MKWTQIKVAFMDLDHNYDYRTLSKMFGPCPSSIHQQATKKPELSDGSIGKSWIEERRDLADALFVSLSPSGRLRSTYEEYDRTLKHPTLDPAKKADALNKLAAGIEKLQSALYNYPNVIDTLQDLAEYTAKNSKTSPDCCRDFFAAALSQYRDEVRRRFEEG